jgi:hypothetical protein
MICSKFAPDLTDCQRTISCHYLESMQITDIIKGELEAIIKVIGADA